MQIRGLRYYIAALLAFCATNAPAQHMHPPAKAPAKPEKKAPAIAAKDTMAVAYDSMANYTHYEGHKHEHDAMADSMHMMSSAFSLHLPMNRNGSGTGWNPDATPVFAYMIHKKEWMVMLHGDVFIRYNHQDISNQGSRGGEKWDAPNMLMAMVQRKIKCKGLFHANLMMSADAIIAGGNGYPLLFQTGETWKGYPLVDRQHPHDLFSEISVSYAYSVSERSDAFIYIGYPGEPALGPVTYMHRPLGGFMPDAPLGHHWQDATHISFGVATLGYHYGKLKIDASSFTGREPDEKRYNFDKPRFDSWSGRLSFNPTKHWALQLSNGFLKSPEALHPAENVIRTTGSVSYVYGFSSNRYFTANGIIGKNNSHDVSSYSKLIEGAYKMPKAVLYLRFEDVQKTGEELVLDPIAYGIQTKYTIYATTLGGGYDLAHIGNVIVAAGAQLSLYVPDRALKPLYGKSPIAAEGYLHLYPKFLQ